MALHVSNVVLPAEYAQGAPPALIEALGLPVEAIGEVMLVKKSLDARWGKQVWRGVFRVEVIDEASVLAARRHGVRAWTDRDDGRYGLVDLAPVPHSWPPDARPIVVGAGPAGLFAALALAEAGAPVVLIERGGPVENRVKVVNDHWRRKAELDPENNILFGEGGAGTFSDGKIYTRRRDGELGFIFRRLVEFGADPDLMREAYAHLGTDKVRAILPRFRERLVELGVDVRFHCAVTGLVIESGTAVGVTLGDGSELRGGPVIVAAGHSARDTLAMLVDSGASAHARQTAIGARIEHPQSLIDSGRYGSADRRELPAASYRLAFNPPDGRRAHTFCMCPGGMVVPASNHPGRAVVNGMSFAARRAFWANSAVIVEVGPDDYDAPGPLGGFAYQDAIEQRCFEAAGGDGRAPAQRVSDLLAGRASSDLPKTSYPLGVTPVDLRELLPAPVIDGMIRAILDFEGTIPGFAGSEAVLIAPETRTTSPIRFDRDERMCSTTLEGLYPVGEGAGYAGGIVSSALDGFRAARSITAQLGTAVEKAVDNSGEAGGG